MSDIERLLGVAAVLSDAGTYRGAIETARRAVDLADEAGPARARINARLRLAEILTTAQRPEEARRVLHVAAQLAGRHGVPARVAIDMAHRSGDALSDAGYFDDALGAYLDGRAIAERADDDAAVTLLDMEIATTLGRIGRTRDALERYEAALAGFERLGNEYSADLCRLNMGPSYRSVGRHDEAIACLERAAEGFERRGSTRLALDARFNLANTRWGLGDLMAARWFYESARPQYAELGLELQVADCDSSLGNLLHEFGDHDTALELIERAVETYDRHGETYEGAAARMNLSHVLAHAGRAQEAEHVLTEAEAAYAELHVEGYEGWAAHARAWAAYLAGDAATVLEQVALAREHGDEDDAPYLDAANAGALMLLGRAREAIPVLEYARERLLRRRSPLMAAEAGAMLVQAFRAAGDHAHEHQLGVAVATEFRAMGLTARADAVAATEEAA